MLTERSALEAVEEVHGSIEQFALFVLTDAKDVLKSENSINLRAQKVGLEPQVLNYILTQSTAFRRLMREVIVNQSFDLEAEVQHIERVKVAATNSEKKEVVTPKGVKTTVDHSLDEVVKAGEYINKYRGTPLSAGETRSGPTLVVNFGSPEGSRDDKTITVESQEVAPTGFKRLRAGGLPPEGARKRYLAGKDGGGKRHALAREGGELDFDSAEARSAAETRKNEESKLVPDESNPGRGDNRTDVESDWVKNWE